MKIAMVAVIQSLGLNSNRAANVSGTDMVSSKELFLPYLAYVNIMKRLHNLRPVCQQWDDHWVTYR